MPFDQVQAKGVPYASNRTDSTTPQWVQRSLGSSTSSMACWEREERLAVTASFTDTICIQPFPTFLLSTCWSSWFWQARAAALRRSWPRWLPFSHSISFSFLPVYLCHLALGGMDCAVCLSRTALITSQLAAVARQSVEQARLREREARILYEAGRVINSTNRLDEQLDTIALALVRVFSPWGVRECALLVPDEDGTLSIQADAPIRIEHFTLSHDEVVAAQEVMAQGKMREVSQASPASQSASAASPQHSILRLIPLKTANQVLGVLCLRIEHGVSWFASAQRMLEQQEQPDDQAIFFGPFSMRLS